MTARLACAETVFLFAVLLAPRAGAFQVTKQDGVELKWSKPGVSYTINPASGPDGARDAILAAMDTWNAVAGSAFRFSYAGPTTDQGVKNDGRSVCSFGYLDEADTLAYNSWWFDPASGHISESDLVFNLSYAWSTTGDAGLYDLQDVATHELGHTLSLDDLYGADDTEKTMYGYSAKGETKKRTLEDDDKAGIIYLYPGVINSPTGSTLTVGVKAEIGPVTAGKGQAGTLSGKLVSGKLPSGMKIEARADGLYVTGVPAKAESCHAVIQPSTKSGAVTVPGVSVTLDITVEALDALATGEFDGWVSGGARGSGVAQVTVSAAGKVSGKLAVGGTNYLFSAASFSGATNGTFYVQAVAKSGKEAFSIRVAVWPDGRAAAELPDDPGAAVFLFRNKWKESGVAEYAGYYTATLPGGAAYGSGYLAITVDKAGGVKTAGKLADGTAVSFSGTLVLDATGRVFTVLYTAPAAYKGGCLSGQAEFAKPAGGGNVFLRPLDGTPFLWESRNPQATEEYSKGFSRETGLTGGRYGTSGNLYDYYQGKALAAATDADAPAPELAVGAVIESSDQWRPDGVALTPVFDKKGVMTGLAAATNAVGLTVTLTRATGVFKGSFKAWFDYGTAYTTKSVAYEGVLTPVRADLSDGVAGRGFFLWAYKGEYGTGAVDRYGNPASYLFNASYDFLLSEH